MCDGCSPVFGEKVIQTASPHPSADGTCKDMHLLLAQNLKEYDRIYIAAYWKNYLVGDQRQFITDFKATLKFLHKYGAKIILVQDSPTWKDHSIERYLRNQNFYDKLNFMLPT